MSSVGQHACSSNVVLKKHLHSSTLLFSQTTYANLLRRFMVVGVSHWLKEQLAMLCSFKNNLYSSSGFGAAPFRSSLSSTVY